MYLCAKTLQFENIHEMHIPFDEMRVLICDGRTFGSLKILKQTLN